MKQLMLEKPSEIYILDFTPGYFLLSSGIL
jgi:hypothetical protein